jgi:hypothetical protein
VWNEREKEGKRKVEALANDRVTVNVAIWDFQGMPRRLIFFFFFFFFFFLDDWIFRL